MIDKINQPKNQAAALAAGGSITNDSNTPPMITFECPCGKHITAPICSAGHKGYCPKCKSGIVIPYPRDKSVTGIRCSCGCEIPPRGHIRRCPQCGRDLAVSRKALFASATHRLILAAIAAAAAAALIYFVFLA